MVETQQDAGDCSWFAIQVRATHEKRVSSLLQGKGYECFLPLEKGRRLWSDRIREVELPLFPGYVFSRFDPVVRLPVLKTPSVLKIVGAGRMPIPVDDAEIAGIQTIVKSRLAVSPYPFMRIGDRVQIRSGPLCGLEGILLEMRQRHRLIVSVTLLQRSVAVDIDSAWVIATSQSSFRKRREPSMVFAPRPG